MMKEIAAAAVAAMAAALFAVDVDGIVATVDSQPILRSDVLAEMRRDGIEDESKFTEVRNALIDRRLILKAAKESKMTMQEWVIDNRVREIVENAFGGDRNQLVATLARQKMPYSEWRNRIKEDMVVAAMRWNVVEKNVTAAPAEMRAEYREHPERYSTMGKVTVSVILLKPSDSELKGEVEKALKSEDFAEVAKAYSADSHAVEGGVWKDVIPAEVFRPEICEEIAKMPKATLSRWIELDGWNFLIRKDDESGSTPRTFAEAYADIESNVKDAKAAKLYEEWIERLRDEAYIHVN